MTRSTFMLMLGLLLVAISCSGPMGDDDTTDEDPTPTEAPSPTVVACKKVGPYEVCGEVTLEQQGDPQELYVLGRVTRHEETDQYLCAWGGTSQNPYYGFSCESTLIYPLELNVEQDFDIDTGYRASLYGNDPTNVSAVLCTTNDAMAHPTCYP